MDDTNEYRKKLPLSGKSFDSNSFSENFYVKIYDGCEGRRQKNHLKLYVKLYFVGIKWSCFRNFSDSISSKDDKLKC